jgi:hypothetical protein
MSYNDIDLGPKLVPLNKDPYRVLRGTEVRINFNGNDCLDGWYAGKNEDGDLVTFPTFSSISTPLHDGSIETMYCIMEKPGYASHSASICIEPFPEGTLEKRVQITSEKPLIRGKPNGT